MLYKEIGKEFGVTAQRVQQLIGSHETVSKWVKLMRYYNAH